MTNAQLRPRSDLWNTMPGWGIVANLLPPEVVAARRAKAVRKLVLLALAGIVVLAAAGFAFASWRVRSANAELLAQQARTTQLQAAQAKYDVVVRLQADIGHVNDELAGLLASSVDMPSFVNELVTASPRPSGLAKLEVDLTSASSTTTTSLASTGSDDGVLDTSGRTHIGTATVSGVVRSIDDVARYVTKLSRLPGVVEVFPLSQQSDGGLVTYSIEMTMTDQLVAGRSTSSNPTATTGGN